MYEIDGYILAMCFFVCILLSLLKFYGLELTIPQHFPRPFTEPVQPLVTEQHMLQVGNPLALKVHEKSSFQNGVKVTFTTRIPHRVIPCWGVNIQKIHHFIDKNWDTHHRIIRTPDLLGSLLQMLSLHTGDKLELDVTDSYTTTFEKPASVCDLGPVPRNQYPFALICHSSCLTSSNFREDQLDHTEIISQVFLIHLQDSVCPLASHVMYHYVRNFAGRPFLLKTLFMSEYPLEDIAKEPSCQTASYSSSHSNDKQFPSNQQRYTCVVCQVAPVTLVYLPCRHACSCDECHPKLKDCPVCRGMIFSHFRLT